MRSYPDYLEEYEADPTEPDLSQAYQDYKDGVSDYYQLQLIKQQLSLFDWAGLTEDGYESLCKRYS